MNPFELRRGRDLPRKPCGVSGCKAPLAIVPRVSLAAFGLEGVGCRNCYQRLKSRHDKVAGTGYQRANATGHTRVARHAPPGSAVATTPAEGARLAIAEYRRATQAPKATTPAKTEATGPVPPTPGKSCPDCKTADRAAFGVNRTKPDGLQVYCKACNNARSRLGKAEATAKRRRARRDGNSFDLEALAGTTG
jgi:hypothetical protein